jgi:hypothetical protein
MATYPTTLIQLTGTTIVGSDGKVIRQTESGSFRIRSYFSAVRKSVVAVHYLTQAQLDTLIAFYVANDTIAFDFVYQADTVTYSCFFTGYPESAPAGGGYYNVATRMIVA